MPWDLIFYGSMAIIFMGIIAASARARRQRRTGGTSEGSTAGTARSDKALSDAGPSDAGGGGSD